MSLVASDDGPLLDAAEIANVRSATRSQQRVVRMVGGELRRLRASLKSLASGRAQLLATIDGGYFAVLITDMDGVIQRASHGAGELLPWAFGEGLLDRSVWSIIFHSERPGLREQVEELRQRPDHGSLAVRIARGESALREDVKAYIHMDRVRVVWFLRVLPDALNGRDSTDGDVTTGPGDALGLSGREAEVLQWVALGKTDKAIARHLEVSVFTVQTHVRRALRKLGANSRTEAVVKALRAGVIA